MWGYPAGPGEAMRLSTKSDYGVRALIELALSGDGAPVQRAEIASRQHIPESYLDHLLAQLRRDGFVRSVRGPGGGHLLTREPEEMCLLHVIESLEGSVAPIACLEEGGECSHEPGECVQRWVWEDIYEETRRRPARHLAGGPRRARARSAPPGRGELLDLISLPGARRGSV